MGKEAYVSQFLEHVKRPGAQELIDWLLSTDFFEAPASTKYHCSYQGGLCEHSYNVFTELQAIYSGRTDVPMESIAICGLLHDICKANFYKVSYRNVKNDDTGVWEKKPYYSVEEKFVFGHGEKSVFLIERHMKLTLEEAVAIRYHMGDFTGDKGTGPAYAAYELALRLHIADIQATYVLEKEIPK